MLVGDKAKEVINCVKPPPPTPVPVHFPSTHEPINVSHHVSHNVSHPALHSYTLDKKNTIKVCFCFYLLLQFIVCFPVGIYLWSQVDMKNICECEYKLVEQKIVNYPIGNGMTSPKEVCIVNGTIVKVIGNPPRHSDLSKDSCEGDFQYILSMCLFIGSPVSLLSYYGFCIQYSRPIHNWLNT